MAHVPQLLPPDVPERKVYVNASLRFQRIRSVGFDMDYTLAVYDETSLEALAFRLAAPHLAQLGYPDMAGRLTYRPGGGIRGLVVDLEAGNVLKVDQYDYVAIAWHGARELDASERRRHYANHAIDLHEPRYESVDTLFSLPNLDLFSQLVALRDARPDDYAGRSYERIWLDVGRAVDQVHQDDSLKAEVMADPARYLLRDPELPVALATLRDQGKRLFLLTNSGLAYTEALMAYLLDDADPARPRWADYFDDVVVDARKPGFFTESRQGEEVATRPLAAGGERVVYRGGNYQELHDRLACDGDQVLFVGDHMFGDVIRSKKDLHWRTMMVLPELGDELSGLSQVRRRRHRFLELVDRMEENDIRCARLRNQLARARAEGRAEEAGRLQSQQLEAVARGEELQRELEDLERVIDRSFHPRWGALLSDGGEVSRFGKQVVDFADLYTSRVPNLARYPAGKCFQSPWDVMPHSRIL